MFESAWSEPIAQQPAQYLFRIYHTPIDATGYQKFESYDPEIDPNWGTNSGYYELNYNDHLFTLPPTTANIVDTANRLCYAEALLYVKSQILFCAVWLVEQGERIDQRSPITVLHPYQSDERKHYFDSYVAARATTRLGRGQMPYLRGEYGSVPDNQYMGFACYDITSTPIDYAMQDAFLVADIARQTRTRRASHQFFRGVVCQDDYYYVGKELCLWDRGSLSVMRFKYFQAVLEQMQFTHSGWNIDEVGKISLDNELLTFRKLNNVTDMAQRRRQFLFRNGVTRKVHRQWQKCLHEVSIDLYRMDVAGWGEQHNMTAVGPNEYNVKYACAPTVWLLRVCLAVMDFVNLAAVAGGANSLAFAPKSVTAAQQKIYWQNICQYLYGKNSIGIPIVQKADTINDKILLAMLDILGVIIGALQDHATGTADFTFNAPVSGSRQTTAFVIKWANAQTAFSSIYASLQGEAHALLGLLCTWEYTFQPIERTKFQAAYKGYKTKAVPEPTAREKRLAFNALIANTKKSVLSDRFYKYMPRMAPYKIWDIKQPDNNLDQIEQEEQQRLERIQLQITRDEIETEEEEEREKRRQKMKEKIDQLEAEYEAAQPDKTDPFDWKNYTNSDWWRTTISVEDLPRFAYNALNTPKIVDVSINMFKLSPRAAVGLKRLEPLIEGVELLIYPHNKIRAVLKSPLFRMVVREVGEAAAKETFSRIHDETMQRIGEANFNQHPPFAPREFWPI